MTTGEMILSNPRINALNKTSLGTAALLAGIGLLIMVIAAPFAELYVFPRLIVAGNAAQTVKNILENRSLFTYALFAYLITFICDVLVAWALYIFLKPVDENFSLLTALFRWVYSAIALVALLHLVTVSDLLNPSHPVSGLQPDAMYAQVMLSIDLFTSHWYFGLIFFAIHLGLIGYLVIRSTYVPKILGVLLIIAGLGYLLNALKPFFFADSNLKFAEYTYYGELIFMLWLLVKGSRIQQPD